MRAGATSGARIALYCLIGFVAAVALWVIITAGFGLHRFVTGLAVGIIVAIAVTAWLFHSDRTTLDEDAIRIRTLRSTRRVEWSRIGTVRYQWPEGSDHWVLTADLDRPADPTSTLLLLATPPVEHPMSNALELRKREQLKDILRVLQDKDIRVIFAPGIATRLAEHWQITAPAA